jgi:hypothetical protein
MIPQYSRNATVSVSTTSGQITQAITGNMMRTQLIITNTSTTAVVTIAKGDQVAIAGQGVVLQPKSTYVEATDGGYYCYQGTVQAICDAGTGSVAVVESFTQ